MSYQTQIVKTLSIVFPISGASCLLASIIDVFKNYQFVKEGLRIEGEVITISTSKQPVIEFLPTGKTKLIEFPSSGFVDYKVGDRVTILHLRDSNPYFMVDTPSSLLLLKISCF